MKASGTPTDPNAYTYEDLAADRLMRSTGGRTTSRLPTADESIGVRCYDPALRRNLTYGELALLETVR